MLARLPARAICIESPQFSASRAAACRGTTLRPSAGQFIARSWQRWCRVRAMVSALAQGLGLTHLTGCAQTPRSLQFTGALGGRPVISHAARRCKTQRQQDVVVAVAAKPVPTMVTETPKVKEVKQSGASKHDLTPEVATDLCKQSSLTALPLNKLNMTGLHDAPCNSALTVSPCAETLTALLRRYIIVCTHKDASSTLGLRSHLSIGVDQERHTLLCRQGHAAGQDFRGQVC